MEINLIVAKDLDNGIGKNNSIPWNYPDDMKHFTQTTQSCENGNINAIIMGRRTWVSIGEKPLKNRKY